MKAAARFLILLTSLVIAPVPCYASTSACGSGGSGCDDGLWCTDPDFCWDYQCIGQPRACNDFNPCTRGQVR